MAQQRQFYNPKRDSRGVYDQEEPSAIPTAPSSRNQNASTGAQNTIDDIDSLLGEQENNPSGAPSSTQTSSPENSETIAAQESRGVPAATKPAGEEEESGGQAGTPGSTPAKGRKEKKVDVAKNFAKQHSKKLMAGAVVTFFLGIAAFIIIPALGPLQLMHLSQILQRSMDKGFNDNTTRMNLLFGYSRAMKTGDVGETRVGVLGSRIFHRTVTQLSAIGIDIERSGTGAPVRTVIDTNKLAATYPELRNMNDVQKRTFLAKKLNLSAGQLAGGAGRFSVDQRVMGLQASRALMKNSLGLLNNGKIVYAVKSRVLAKFLNIPSIFHPLQRALSAKENTIMGRVTAEEQRKREAERRETLREPSRATATAAIDEVKRSSNKFNSFAMRALLFTGGVCFVRDVADEVITINRARVVLPAVTEAMDKMAVGEQLKSGYDMTAAQAGGVLASLEDKDGKSIWDAKALNALANDGTDKGGPDISGDYQQAFSSDTTAATIIGWTDVALGGYGEAACSTAGLIIQGLAAIGLAAVSLVGEVGSAGALTPAIAAIWAGKQALSAAITALVMHFAQTLIVNATSADVLPDDAFRGTSGGNMLAYGAREGANMVGRASGAVDLGNQDSTLMWSQREEEEKKQFQSQSLYARLFNVRDYRSLTGRLATSMSLSWRGNLAASLDGIFLRNLSLMNVFGPLLPKVSAAEAPAYNWAFSQFGLPQSILNDPDLQDPYANADKIVPLLNGGEGQTYIDRAKSCFGVTIAKTSDGLWDTNPTVDVNPNDVAYIDAKCAEISDAQDPGKNWRRLILFVFDTTTMKAVACFDGDETACREVAGKTSAPAGGATGGTGGTALPAGDTIALANQILAKPDIISFQTPQKEAYFRNIAANGRGTSCGAPAISPMLLGTILKLSESYKLVLGVLNDGHDDGGGGSCSDGFHHKGAAVDINGVNPLNGAAVTGTRIGDGPGEAKFDPEEMAILSQFYKSAGDILGANGGGGLGQQQCFSTPPVKVSAPPNVYFNDTCNHIHIDTRGK